MTFLRSQTVVPPHTGVMIPLYHRVLGSRFDELADRVACLHRVDRATVWTGTCDVVRGERWLSRAIATLFRLPQAGRDQPLTVSFIPHADGRETWDRQFGSRQFRSVQGYHGAGIIAERVGVTTLLLRPDVDGGALSLSVVGARLMGLPLPRALLPVVATREFERDGRYRFDVRATMPWIGLLVHYSGSLVQQS